MITAAVRRALYRLDRNRTAGVLLAAGILFSVAVFLHLGQRERASAAAQFRIVAADRTGAIQREILNRATLLATIVRLLNRPDVPPGSVQQIVDACCGAPGAGVLVLWIPWDGPGNPGEDWKRVERFAAAWKWRGDHAPGWLADALRRAVRGGGTITVPAATASGAELLVFAAPVSGPGGGIRGVACVIDRVGDIVERGIGTAAPADLDLVLEDATEGGRRIYRHRSREYAAGPGGHPALIYETPLHFADREWTVRALSVSAFLSGQNRWTRWNLLAAMLLVTMLVAAMTREVLRPAACVRALVAARRRRLRQVNRRLIAEADVRREAEQRLALTREAASVGMWEWDILRGRTTSTPEVFRIFGLPPGPEFPAHDEWLALVHPEDRERIDGELSRALESSGNYESEYRIIRPDGAVRWLLTKARLFRDEDGRPARMLGVNVDVTELKEAELALNENQARMRRMFANAAIGVVMSDRDGRMLEVNDFACQVTGYSRAEMLAMRTRDLIHAGDLDRHLRRMGDLVGGAVPDYVAETRIVRRDKGVLWMRVSVSPTMEDGACTGIVALCEDITARRQAEAQLEYQSLNDTLTGLPNRRLFNDRLQQSLAEARRSGDSVAVFYLDIDGFRSANETLGQTTGDALLLEAGRRLRGTVRATDTLARMAGDEFAVIVPHLHDTADAGRVGRKLIDSLAAPFRAGEKEIALTACAGVSLFPRHSTDAADLLLHAQAATRAARREGRGQLSFFTPELGRAVRERVELEGQLRGAATRGEIVVHYQPEYDLRDGRLVGFESLARWKHPDLGLVSPARFIPIAEETGLIVPIGLSVLEQACREALRWQRSGRDPVQVAVNVSSIQFFHEDFVNCVFEILERTGLPPNLLQLELTESVVVAGFSGPAAKMAQLRERGITLAVDDFGTGYSSLSYLPRLPFQAMKIDRSFVRNLHEISESRAMIQSLVALAHNLNLNVVVEGVETPEELSAVRTLGCDTVQGYLLGRPSASTRRHLDGDRRLLLPSEVLTYS